LAGAQKSVESAVFLAYTEHCWTLNIHISKATGYKTVSANSNLLVLIFQILNSCSAEETNNDKMKQIRSFCSGVHCAVHHLYRKQVFFVSHCWNPLVLCVFLPTPPLAHFAVFFRCNRQHCSVQLTKKWCALSVDIDV